MMNLNRQQALDQIAKEMPDLLITAVQIPKMNGIDLCEAINRDYPQLKKLIIVMASQPHREWVKPHSHIALMEKPLSLRRLISRINTCFSQ